MRGLEVRLSINTMNCTFGGEKPRQAFNKSTFQPMARAPKPQKDTFCFMTGDPTEDALLQTLLNAVTEYCDADARYNAAVKLKKEAEKAAEINNRKAELSPQQIIDQKLKLCARLSTISPRIKKEIAIQQQNLRTDMLGLKRGAREEEIQAIIAHRHRIALCQSLGLSPNVRDKEIIRAQKEQERKLLIEFYGLPDNASDNTIFGAQAQYERAILLQTLNLPDNTNDLDIIYAIRDLLAGGE